MKLLLSSILWLFSLVLFPQKDDSAKMFIHFEYDDMEDKKTYYASDWIIISNSKKTQGFTIKPFFDEVGNDLEVKDLLVNTVNIGNCNEDNKLIIMLEDSTKLNLKSWNDFNCEDYSYFRITESEMELLKLKKILKMKFINGSTNDEFTGIVPEKKRSYFIELADAIQSKRIKEVKK